MKFHKNKQGKLVRKATVTAPKHTGYKAGAPVVIEFGITKCKFASSYPKVMDKAMASPVPGYVFTPQYQNGNWDGHHHFLTRAGYFPTGLLPVVYYILLKGHHPLIEEGEKGWGVLTVLPSKVTIKVPTKCAEFYYPGMALYYLHGDEELLDSLDDESGTFSFPLHLLRSWKGVEGKNTATRSVLNLAKSLRNNALRDTHA